MLRNYLIQSILNLTMEAQENHGLVRRNGRRQELLSVLRDEHDNDLIIRHSILMKGVSYDR